MNEQIDPTIKALTQAIGEAETGPSNPAAYTKRGASGEFGRYQFMPDTYKAYAKKYLGDEKASPTVENQNKIAYSFVSEKKKQGYNPAQIASMWNAGEGRPNAYREDFKGVNSKGVAYDTPAYALKVSQAYERLKGSTGGIQQDVPMQPQKQTLAGDIGETLGKAGTDLSTAIGNAFSGKINPVSGVIQSVGAIAGGIGGLTTDLIEHTPIVGDIFKGAEDLVGKGVTALANTEAGQNTIKGYQQWAQEHPELAGNINAGINIATAIPVLKGVGVAKDVAKSGVNKALRGGTDAVVDAVSPRLTPMESAKALATRGTVQRGLLRETQLAPDPFVGKIAESVKAYVPRFNPSAPLTENITEVQAVVSTMAKTLKKAVIDAGANRIYPKRELIARLRRLEKPDLIASDNTLNNVYDRLIKRVEGLAEQNGGKVSNLLDLRQEFDQLVKRQYPNLYSNETLTPLRQAVKDIRDSITDFTVENLPDGVGLRESLMTQHHLLTAIENMAEKATKGATKEIGTNALTRFGARHPVIRGVLRTGGKAAAEGTGIGAMLKILD